MRRVRRNVSRVSISEGLEDRHPFEGIGALSAGASSRLLQDYGSVGSEGKVIAGVGSDLAVSTGL